MPPLLQLEDLRICFRQDDHASEVVHGLNLQMQEGEKLAIVGESGSGKSVTGLSLGRLLPSAPVCEVSGRILFRGEDVQTFDAKRVREHRGSGVAYVFQEPSSSLHPQLTVGEQIREAIHLHQPSVRDKKAAVVEALDEVGIPDPVRRVKCYPHELSGGMQQRVVIAMALACKPALLVADEPTTALDVTIQAQILKLLDRMQEKHQMGVILITHNFGIVDGFADRLVVMHDGNIVEQGITEEVLKQPKAAYTRDLLGCIPRMDQKLERLISRVSVETVS